MDKQPAVYILASAHHGTLYIGVTSNLITRVWQHRQGFVPGFTHRYGVTQLVWCEQHIDILGAIQREKRLTEWKRAWKVALIERTNPAWRDLWFDLVGDGDVSGSRLSPG